MAEVTGRAGAAAASCRYLQTGTWAQSGLADLSDERGLTTSLRLFSSNYLPPRRLIYMRSNCISNWERRCVAHGKQVCGERTTARCAGHGLTMSLRPHKQADVASLSKSRKIVVYCRIPTCSYTLNRTEHTTQHNTEDHSVASIGRLRGANKFPITSYQVAPVIGPCPARSLGSAVVGVGYILF